MTFEAKTHLDNMGLTELSSNDCHNLPTAVLCDRCISARRDHTHKEANELLEMIKQEFLKSTTRLCI